MPTLEYHLRRSIKPGAESRIFLRIIHNRKSCNISTPYKIYEKEWDKEYRTVYTSRSYSSREIFLRKVGKALEDDLNFMRIIIYRLEQYNNEYSVEDIAAAYKRRISKYPLVKYINELRREMIKIGRGRTALAYASVRNSVTEFAGADLTLNQINLPFVREYENDLKARKISNNSISFYMRNLRAIYNKAIKDNLVEAIVLDPFEYAYTKVDIKGKSPQRKLKYQIDEDSETEENDDSSLLED